MSVSNTKGTHFSLSTATVVPRTRRSVTLYVLFLPFFSRVLKIRYEYFQILWSSYVVSSLGLDSLNFGLVAYRSVSLLLWYNTSSGSQMNPARYSLRYDNVMSGQGYRTPQGAVWGHVAAFAAHVPTWIIQLVHCDCWNVSPSVLP